MTQFEMAEFAKDSLFSQKIEHPDGDIYVKGLTKREYFAAMAMQGMLANGCSIDIDKEYPFETRAKTCILIADALIKALNEIQP